MTLSFKEFKDEAAKILNINLDGYKIKRVQRRTDSLMRRHNIDDYDRCLELLKHDEDFRAAYLNHFTINTSEFYRNPENFNYLQEKILPELLEKKGKVRIWSAPCSNGSEPYTLAIILNELGCKPGDYEILAVDIDPGIIEDAKKAVYGPNSVQNVEPKIIYKYFTPIPGNTKKYKLKRKIVNSVTFKKMDLIYDSFEKNWDIILSRNFFIYLTREIKEELVHKFTAALNPDGYLFLGNTEFIFNPEKFGLKKVYSSFYQKKS